MILEHLAKLSPRLASQRVSQSSTAPLHLTLAE